jgi:DNA sulfur modification protein DndB
MQLEFPAVKGRMGRKTFYVATVPLKIVPQLFSLEEWDELSPELRAQRVLNVRRVPDITNYLVQHDEDWVFSSLTAAYRVKETFVPSKENPNIGILRMPMTRFLINDGQHRVAAISEALRLNRTLRDQEISVLLFREENLARNQQIFSDLNRTVQKTSRSLDILYDHRDFFSEIAMGVGEAVPLFKGKIDKDRASLAAGNPNVITLSTLYDANLQFFNGDLDGIAKRPAKTLINQATQYWNDLTEYVEPFKLILEGAKKPGEIRAESVAAHSVSFWAFGTLGCRLYSTEGTQQARRARLQKLSRVDWRKTNQKDWQGIIMLGPDIVTRRQSRDAMTEMLRFFTGMRSTRPPKVLEPGKP